MEPYYFRLPPLHLTDPTRFDPLLDGAVHVGPQEALLYPRSDLVDALVSALIMSPELGLRLV